MTTLVSLVAMLFRLPQITKSDEEPTSFTRVGNEADLIR
jgi:hypothetical protein